MMPAWAFLLQAAGPALQGMWGFVHLTYRPALVASLGVEPLILALAIRGLWGATGYSPACGFGCCVFFFFFLHTAHPLGRCMGPLVSLWRGKATVIHGPASLQPSPLTLWGGHTQLLAKEGTLHFPMQLRFFGLYLRDLIFDFPYTRVSRLCCELLLTDMRD